MLLDCFLGRRKHRSSHYKDTKTESSFYWYMVYLKIQIKLLYLLLSFSLFFLIFEIWFHQLGNISSFKCFSYLTRYYMYNLLFALAILTNPTSSSPPTFQSFLYKWALLTTSVLKFIPFFTSKMSGQRVNHFASLQPEIFFLLIRCKISGIFLEIRGEISFQFCFVF